MTREDVKELIMVIAATYPSFNAKVADKTATINAWSIFLKDYDKQTIMMALQTYVNVSNSAFAPEVSQLIAMANKPAELSELTEADAWSLVSKALRNSTYNSQSEFERLPENVRKAVGSPNQLYVWATDSNYNEGVVMSVFQKNYRTVVNRSNEINMLPASVRNLISQTTQQMIGVDDGKYD